MNTVIEADERRTRRRSGERVSLSCTLRPDQLEQAQAMADQEDVSVSHVIRRALDQMFKLRGCAR